VPFMEFRTTVVIEIYRVCCPDCGIRTEKVPSYPVRPLFSNGLRKRCARRARVPRHGKSPGDSACRPSNVRVIDLRYLECWAEARRKPALALMGMDEIHPGRCSKMAIRRAEFRAR
jgi:hypothetical protein